jgi:hypothetical protein
VNSQAGAVIDGKKQTGRQVSISQGFPDSLLLDINGAAAFAGLTPWQVRGLIANGDLSVVQVGRKLYMRRATITRWAERAEERHKV